MGELIAVLSGKGGTGKTSVCAGIATALARRGHGVLAVDKESLITLFTQRLSELADSYDSRDKSVTENEFYENHRVSDLSEEEFVSRELCEYIDAFYDKRHEYKSSGLSSDEWFENEIDKIII